MDNIRCAFENLTLKELKSLVRMCSYPIRLGLAKADLVDALVDNVRKNPVGLLKGLPVYDLLVISELCKVGMSDSLTCFRFPGMLYAMRYNIVEWDLPNGDDTRLELWLNDDMYSLLAPFVDQVFDDVMSSGRYVVEYLFWGMLWVYGVPDWTSFVKLLQRNYGTDDPRIFGFMKFLNAYHPFRDLDRKGIIVNPAIADLEFMNGQLRSRGMESKALKAYSIEEIIEVGSTGPYFHYGDGTTKWNKAVAALTRCGYDEEDAKAALSRMWLDLQDADGPRKPSWPLMKLLERRTMTSVDAINSVLADISDYLNSIPRWFLRGAVPTDFRVGQEKMSPYVAPTSSTARPMPKQVFGNVGRNDPCPCGSGLKFKKCHGKNIC